MAQPVDLNKDWPKPQNALGAVVIYMQLNRSVDAAAAPEIDKWLPWLQHLITKVQYMTTRPLLAFAFGRLAMDGDERKRFRAALEALDAETLAAGS